MSSMAVYVRVSMAMNVMTTDTASEHSGLLFGEGWRSRREAEEQAEAAALENARDAGFGDAEVAGDVLLGAALTAHE
jgi:hypothetical protein